MATEQDGDRGAEDFVLGEGIPFAAGVDHEREHIIALRGLAFNDASPQLGPQVEQGLL